ncbi:MAG: HAMP domain-containing sensor histidine kinase [Caldimonas sp.]
MAAPQNLHYDLALAIQEYRNVQLQETNRQLALAATRSQEQLVCAERARRKQIEFLAVVAHELRNPLAPIRAVAELLGRIEPDPDGALSRLQAVIERQVVHISRLIDDLLDLSRADCGKLRLQTTIVDLQLIIEAAIDACRPAVQRRGQVLRLVLSGCPLAVDGDPVRLAQVLGNLLDNACKYTPDGGTIELLAAVAGDLVVMSVSDSGIGIAPEALPYVFEPFAQEIREPGVAGTGLGLGLAVVSELVEAHGGCVVAHSAGRGSGSRFVVTLPLAGADATARAVIASRRREGMHP